MNQEQSCTEIDLQQTTFFKFLDKKVPKNNLDLNSIISWQKIDDFKNKLPDVLKNEVGLEEDEYKTFEICKDERKSEENIEIDIKFDKIISDEESCRSFEISDVNDIMEGIIKTKKDDVDPQNAQLITENDNKQIVQKNPFVEELSSIIETQKKVFQEDKNINFQNQKNVLNLDQFNSNKSSYTPFDMNYYKNISLNQNPDKNWSKYYLKSNSTSIHNLQDENFAILQNRKNWLKNYSTLSKSFILSKFDYSIMSYSEFDYNFGQNNVEGTKLKKPLKKSEIISVYFQTVFLEKSYKDKELVKNLNNWLESIFTVCSCDELLFGKKTEFIQILKKWLETIDKNDQTYFNKSMNECLINNPTFIDIYQMIMSNLFKKIPKLIDLEKLTIIKAQNLKIFKEKLKEFNELDLKNEIFENILDEKDNDCTTLRFFLSILSHIFLLNSKNYVYFAKNNQFDMFQTSVGGPNSPKNFSYSSYRTVYSSLSTPALRLLFIIQNPSEKTTAQNPDQIDFKMFALQNEKFDTVSKTKDSPRTENKSNPSQHKNFNILIEGNCNKGDQSSFLNNIETIETPRLITNKENFNSFSFKQRSKSIHKSSPVLVEVDGIKKQVKQYRNVDSSTDNNTESYDRYNSSLRRVNATANLLDTNDKNASYLQSKEKQRLANVSSFSLQAEKFDIKNKELAIKTYEKPNLFIDKKTFGNYLNTHSNEKVIGNYMNTFSNEKVRANHDLNTDSGKKVTASHEIGQINKPLNSYRYLRKAIDFSNVSKEKPEKDLGDQSSMISDNEKSVNKSKTYIDKVDEYKMLSYKTKSHREYRSSYNRKPLQERKNYDHSVEILAKKNVDSNNAKNNGEKSDLHENSGINKYVDLKSQRHYQYNYSLHLYNDQHKTDTSCEKSKQNIKRHENSKSLLDSSNLLASKSYTNKYKDLQNSFNLDENGNMVYQKSKNYYSFYNNSNYYNNLVDKSATEKNETKNDQENNKNVKDTSGTNERLKTYTNERYGRRYDKYSVASMRHNKTQDKYKKVQDESKIEKNTSDPKQEENPVYKRYYNSSFLSLKNVDILKTDIKKPKDLSTEKNESNTVLTSTNKYQNLEYKNGSQTPNLSTRYYNRSYTSHEVPQKNDDTQNSYLNINTLTEPKKPSDKYSTKIDTQKDVKNVKSHRKDVVEFWTNKLSANYHR